MDKSHRNDNNEIVIVGEHGYPYHRKHKGINLKGIFNNWKGSLGIIATVTTIVVGGAGINQYLSEKPNISAYVEEIFIDANSFKIVRFESPIIASLETKDLKFIESAFKNEYPYILAVQDINKKVWSSEGELLSFDIDIEGNKLEQETIEIIKKKFK